MDAKTMSERVIIQPLGSKPGRVIALVIAGDVTAYRVRYEIGEQSFEGVYFEDELLEATQKPA